MSLNILNTFKATLKYAFLQLSVFYVLVTSAIFTPNCRVNTGVSDKMNCGPILSLTAIPVSQHAQYQSPGPPKWDRAIINVINYTCVYPAIGLKMAAVKKPRHPDKK